ncbi:hypothetical protein EUTSA_v10015678mg, partial [Eutrema salsugineum]
GVDCFACLDIEGYSANMPPPQRLSVMIDHPTLMQPDMTVQLAQNEGATHECIELKELGVMKLTALFVARYGMRFWWGLMKKVDKKPQFKFMEPSDGKFSVYNRILVAYEGVIWACDNVCTATVLGAFFRCLQLEMLEEGTETDMIDLHAFVSGVAWFGQVEDDDYSTFMPHPQLLSLMSNRLIPGSLVTHFQGPSRVRRSRWD